MTDYLSAKETAAVIRRNLMNYGQFKNYTTQEVKALASSHRISGAVHRPFLRFSKKGIEQLISEWSQYSIGPEDIRW